MNAEQKQRAMQILRRFEQADPMTRQVDNAAVDLAALLQELIDTPEQAAGVPDGWKLVPEKPTVDMIVDGLNARYIGGGCDEGTMARRMYTALLAAAPEAPAPSVPDEQLQAAFDRGLKAGSEIAMNQLLEALK